MSSFVSSVIIRGQAHLLSFCLWNHKTSKSTWFNIYRYTTTVLIMGRYSVKRYKTKRRTRDLDLIYNDLSSPESINKLKNQPWDELKPGLGQ